MKICSKLLRFGIFSRSELIYISPVLILILIPFLPSLESSNFNDNFEILWGPVRLLDNNQTAQLTMDRSSGSGFQSKNEYLFGSMSMGIKLIRGNSAGTVTTFYMSSDEASHDELDFEFLGIVAGQPYTLQTNVFVNGIGNREQRINLWFDPTVAFHNYSILWNHKQIVFWIDSIPIRVFKNIEESAGIPYLRSRPMRIHTSLWNGEKWATEGGKVKIDWSKAPFVASYISFQVKGCSGLSNSSAPCVNQWWEQPEFGNLNQQQLSKLYWVRKNYMTYDYCEDRSGRFSSTPAECAVNP